MPGERTVDFGSKLREARERRGVSLRQIANSTKISVTVLEALERNDISRLPGGIFSRAFVRSFAAEVGLDPEATIQDFIAQFPHDSVTAGHPTSDQLEDHEAVESDRRMAGTFLWLIAISAVIAAGVLYFTMAGRRAAAAAEPAPVVSAPQPPPVRPPPEPAPPAAAEPANPSTVTPSATPAATSAATPPATPPAAAPADVLTIQLTAVRPCWVSATVDGQKAFERLISPGETRTIEVRREMVLTAGDASAIALKLNGADARPLGKAGEVVAARINLKNFQDYLKPR